MRKRVIGPSFALFLISLLCLRFVSVTVWIIDSLENVQRSERDQQVEWSKERMASAQQDKRKTVLAQRIASGRFCEGCMCRALLKWLDNLLSHRYKGFFDIDTGLGTDFEEIQAIVLLRKLLGFFKRHLTL